MTDTPGTKMGTILYGYITDIKLFLISNVSMNVIIILR